MQFTPSLFQLLHNPLQSSVLKVQRNQKQCLNAVFTIKTLNGTYPLWYQFL